MNAEEAREVADKASNKATSTEMNEVLEEIRAKAHAGEYKAYFYKHLSNKTVKALKESGFNYVSSFDRNEIIVTISW